MAAPLSAQKPLAEMDDYERDAYFGQIAAMLQQGWTRAAIARHYGLSDQTARRHIARAKGMLESASAPLVMVDDIPRPAVAGRQVQIVPSEEREALKGGRLTKSGNAGVRVGSVVPHPEGGDWRLENVTLPELRRMPPADLIARMIRVSPELSRAYYDFLRMANPGWELKAYRPTGAKSPHKQGQEYLDECVRQLSRRHGSVEVVWNQLLSNLFVRGALFCEMVLDGDGRTFMDIVVPDAYSARFKVVPDPDMGGEKFQLVQGDGKNQVILDRPTIKYVPFDPLPDTPYGTSVIAPGLFPAMFLITMLQDARRVVAQQGWPRLDIMVEVAKIVAAMPDRDKQDATKIKAWVEQAVAEIARSYSELDPDQAWVHTDTVTFGNPIGAIGNLEGIDALVAVLERMAIRAVKSMPLLFGLPEGVSEANANRQWEVHVQGVQSIQVIGEEVLSTLFTLALEAQGIPAIASFDFHELRAAEELRDAQVMFQKLENAQRMELLGYEDHDSASNYAVGHPAAETPIGAVGDEEDQPEEDENDNPESGAVMEGDSGDEKPPKTDDGATLSSANGYYRENDLDAVIRALSAPQTAEGVAFGMALLSGRLTPKLPAKGSAQSSGEETVKINKADVVAARRDFDYRIDEPYVGILNALPLDKEGGDT